jgi:Zn-finger nucleic acid-binding protein
MSETLCPKCTTPMNTWTSKGVTLDHCQRCQGLWFDEGELSRHIRNMGGDIRECEPRDGHVTPYPCPRCRGNHLVEGVLQSVRVDSCPRCRGLFLDLGEVHELLGAIHRAEYTSDPRVAGLDNLALGLFIGAGLGGNTRK